MACYNKDNGLVWMVEYASCDIYLAIEEGMMADELGKTVCGDYIAKRV